MKTYIAFLRGINVGGHKKLPMVELRALFETLRFTDVQTYIQSGNVVFSSEEKITGQIISEAIKMKYGWEVPVLVTTSEEIQNILEVCPFPKEQKEKGYFGLLFKSPTTKAIETTNSFEFQNEEFYISYQCVYLFFPAGYGKSKMSGNFFEKKLDVTITTRNYRTLMKLISLAN